MESTPTTPATPAILVLALVVACAPCAAQTEPSERNEPNVRRTVVEDDGARIDELRVRGQTERVVVTPKVGLTRRYEIIVGRGGRQAGDGTGGATSAVGKRVWNVLEF